MNAFLNTIERKFGRYSVPQLTKFIILTYIIGYLLYFIEALTHVRVMELIFLSPRLIIKGGQVWRIFTWIFMPPTRPDIFTVIMLFFYYRIGTALEQTWGDFRYNLYIFSGLFFMFAGAFVLYGFGINVDGMFTTYYITMSIFLAFAACYPNMQVMLYFLIPLKIKYLAFLDVALIAINAVYATVPERLAIVFSLLNFVIFFFTTRNYRSISPAERARKNNFKKAMEQGSYRSGGRTGSGFFTGAKQTVNYNAGETVKKGQISKHKCAICGRTEIDHPELEFRFCSKCEGNYEYCNDHLFTHKHVTFKDQ